MCSQADVDKSGYIEIGEFARLLREHLEIDASKYPKRSFFRHVPNDVMTFCGVVTDNDEVIEMMALFDTDGDGRLAYAEFVKCLHTY